MSLKAYPSPSRIAALASKQGHVVGVEDGKTVIETGTETVTFAQNGEIRAADGTRIGLEDAAKRLGIDLA